LELPTWHSFIAFSGRVINCACDPLSGQLEDGDTGFGRSVGVMEAGQSECLGDGKCRVGWLKETLLGAGA